MDFAAALQTHLDAIQNRDLDGFMATIGDDPLIILPTGVRIAGRDVVREFHSVWFSDPDWTMQFEILRTVVSAEMGFALLDVDYHDIGSDGQPYEKHYYLALVFANSDGRWVLVHDQNTFISPL